MNSRSLGFSSLILGSGAALGALTASYGLVYPARANHTKAPLAVALLVGAVAACFAGWLALSAHRRATQRSERFLAIVGLVLSAFFLFVVVFGFGIPDLVLETGD
jgi:CHASE3 domain sensor protein